MDRRRKGERWSSTVGAVGGGAVVRPAPRWGYQPEASMQRQPLGPRLQSMHLSLERGKSQRQSQSSMVMGGWAGRRAPPGRVEWGGRQPSEFSRITTPSPPRWRVCM